MLYTIFDSITLRKALADAHEAFLSQGLEENCLFSCKLVFSELASNALKHSDGGQITIAFHGDRVELTLACKGGRNIPEKSHPVSVYEESGRGLYLIDSVCHSRENTKDGVKIVVIR